MTPKDNVSMADRQKVHSMINRNDKRAMGFAGLGLVCTGLLVGSVALSWPVWPVLIGGFVVGIGFADAMMTSEELRTLSHDQLSVLVRTPPSKNVLDLMTTAPAQFIGNDEVLAESQVAVQQPVHSSASIMKALPAAMSPTSAVMVANEVVSTLVEDKAAKIVAQAKKSAVEYCKSIATQNSEEDVSANNVDVVVDIATEASKQNVSQASAVSAATSMPSSFKSTLFSFAKRIKHKQNSLAGVDLGVPLLEVSQRM